MMHEAAPVLFYQQERANWEAVLSSLKKKNNNFGWLRLAIVLATAILSFVLLSHDNVAGYFILFFGIAAFLFAVSKNVALAKKIRNTDNLVRINKEELRFLQNEYYHRYDGNDLAPSDHPYANDLDVFGKASLFQYVNRCSSQQGQQLLAKNLLQPLTVPEILERQIAVNELRMDVEWRQQFEAFGMQQEVKIETQIRLEKWVHEDDGSFQKKRWSYIIPAYTFITIASLIAAIFGFIPMAIFSPLFIIYFFIAGSFSKKAGAAAGALHHTAKEIDTIAEWMQWIETKQFAAPLLTEWQQKIKVENTPAYVQMNQLQVVLGRFDMRLNFLVFIFLNSFALWDVRQLRALNKWKENNKEKLSLWYQCIATFEVVHSLATLHFNKPKWCTPQFSSEHFTLQSTDIGHPLIAEEKKISSDFSIKGTGKIAVVTGSNMAGKSTFLRSLGCNIILAQSGAVVCAKSFMLSPVQLMSSMRIADNLAENTSTFYAELKKLKSIIEAVNDHFPLFILLDEILRGTNSFDRHTGSKALMQQLLKEKAVAVLATHDVDLATITTASDGAIENYHFDAQVEGEELYFDYKLKPGICTNLNASILMKKIGIALE